MGGYPPQGTGAIPGDQMALTAAERLIVQALLLSDATPFDGADIAAILADTATITWGDITGLVNDMGVFPTANYATVAAFVEDIRTRVIAITTDITEGKRRAFKHTFTYTTVSASIASAAEQDLATSGEVTVTFPSGATKLRAIVVASIKANNQTAAEHNIGITLQNDINNAGWADLVDLTANMPLTLPEVDATADALTIITAVDAFVTGNTVEFRFQVDSDNAGEVHYTCTFVLSVEYDFQ